MSQPEPADLAFSTLACPAWSLEHALAAATRYGYGGVELRLIDDEAITPALVESNLSRLAAAAASSGARICALGTSVWLALDGPGWRDDFRRYCASASTLEIPVVRVWGGRYSPPTTLSEAASQVAERLDAAAGIAAAAGVRVALATHDHFCSLDAVQAVFSRVADPTVGLVWDVGSTYTTAGSTPEQVWEALGERIVQVHVRDSLRGLGGAWAPVLLGDGEVPVADALGLLRRVGFRGWISVNWPSLPGLPEPEIALPRYAKRLQELR
jgi:sugar phosphate isomerase/epimerase